MGDTEPVRVSPAQTYREGIEAEMRLQFFTAGDHTDVVALREIIQDLAVEIMMRIPRGRQRSLALASLEDVQMRANRGLFSKHAAR